MPEGVFEFECPCCGATLEVDGESGVLLSHRAPKKTSAPGDLQDAVRRLQSEQSGREERFRRQFEAEQQHGKTLEKRFEGLLKKAKTEDPTPRFPRDIDLD